MGKYKKGHFISTHRSNDKLQISPSVNQLTSSPMERISVLWCRLWLLHETSCTLWSTYRQQAKRRDEPETRRIFSFDTTSCGNVPCRSTGNSKNLAISYISIGWILLEYGKSAFKSAIRLYDLSNQETTGAIHSTVSLLMVNLSPIEILIFV